MADSSVSGVCRQSSSLSYTRLVRFWVYFLLLGFVRRRTTYIFVILVSTVQLTVLNVHQPATISIERNVRSPSIFPSVFISGSSLYRRRRKSRGFFFHSLFWSKVARLLLYNSCCAAVVVWVCICYTTYSQYYHRFSLHLFCAPESAVAFYHITELLSRIKYGNRQLEAQLPVFFAYT